MGLAASTSPVPSFLLRGLTRNRRGSVKLIVCEAYEMGSSPPPAIIRAWSVGERSEK